MALLLNGCLGAASHNLTLSPGYVPPPHPRVEVAPVTNDTGEQFDLDVCSELRNALNQELTRQHLDIASMPEASKLVLQTRILDYEKGNAFKRWLWPGYGGTRLIVQANLCTPDNKEVGSIRVVRSVEMGGVYSVGEWKEIFATVARDIVSEVKDKVVNSPPADKAATH